MDEKFKFEYRSLTDEIKFEYRPLTDEIKFAYLRSVLRRSCKFVLFPPNPIWGACCSPCPPYPPRCSDSRSYYSSSQRCACPARVRWRCRLRSGRRSWRNVGRSTRPRRRWRCCCRQARRGTCREESRTIEPSSPAGDGTSDRLRSRERSWSNG